MSSDYKDAAAGNLLSSRVLANRLLWQMRQNKN
jgi:hypothetical protein